MVAYSFKPRFVDPIRVGLGMPVEPFSAAGAAPPAVILPKRQTIRAVGLRVHARPGDELQLYCGMRTRGCFMIGKARCAQARPIYIEVEAPLVVVGEGKSRRRITAPSELDEFARSDGFASYVEFGMFWYEEHHDIMNDFRGVLVEWQPIAGAPPG